MIMSQQTNIMSLKKLINKIAHSHYQITVHPPNRLAYALLGRRTLGLADAATVFFHQENRA